MKFENKMLQNYNWLCNCENRYFKLKSEICHFMRFLAHFQYNLEEEY